MYLCVLCVGLCVYSRCLRIGMFAYLCICICVLCVYVYLGSSIPNKSFVLTILAMGKVEIELSIWKEKKQADFFLYF